MLHDCVDGLAASGNRFVLTSRYTARALRLLRDRSARFEVIHMPALTVEDTLDILGLAAGLPPATPHEAEYTARTVHALADGRPAYVRALADELAAMRERGGPGGGDADQRAGGAAGARTAASRSSALLLRAAAAPRPRLRRAQGDPRNPRAKKKG